MDYVGMIADLYEMVSRALDHGLSNFAGELIWTIRMFRATAMG